MHQFESQRQETYLRICAANKYLDQPTHMRIFIVKNANFLHAGNEDANQTVWMRMLI